jgi:hypothetical protein
LLPRNKKKERLSPHLYKILKSSRKNSLAKYHRLKTMDSKYNKLQQKGRKQLKHKEYNKSLKKKDKVKKFNKLPRYKQKLEQRSRQQ